MKYIEFNVTGHKFNNISAFNAANALCKTTMGIPHPSDTVTKEVIDPDPSYKLNGDIDFYYCVADLAPVLGPTIDFTIRIKVPDDGI